MLEYLLNISLTSFFSQSSSLTYVLHWSWVASFTILFFWRILIAVYHHYYFLFSSSDRDSEVCLQALRLLQSLLLEGDVLAQISPNLQRSLPVERIHQLASSRHSALRQTAHEMMEDIKCLTKTQKTTSEKEQ